MLNLIGLAFITIAATMAYPGLLSSWAYPGFAIGITASGYSFRVGSLIIAAIFVAAGIALWLRREWARQVLLGACLFLFVAIALIIMKGFVPFVAFGLLAAGTNSGETWLFLFVGLSILASILLLVLAFRYLRLQRVADLFTPSGSIAISPRTASRQPLLIAVLFLVLAFPLNRDVNWWASEMPEFIRTPAMSKGVAERRAADDAKLGMNWAFSDDERTIVLQSADNETAFVVLDVESGKVTRKSTSVYSVYMNSHPSEAPWHSLSPDAKRFVNARGDLVTLANDRKSRLTAFPPPLNHSRVGFADTARFLVHERIGVNGVIKLIDVEADRVLYSVGLAHDYDLRSGKWSPDRKQFAWAAYKTDRSTYDQPRELNILDVASGKVDAIEAPCEINRIEGYSRDGELIYLVCKAEHWPPITQACYPTMASGGFRGLLYDTVQRNFTALDDLPYGSVLNASAKEDRLIYRTVCSEGSIISKHPSRMFGQPQWSLAIGKRSPIVTADGKLLVAFNGERDGERTLQFAPLNEATEAALPIFHDANLILRNGKLIASSPSGAILLAIASPAVEVIRADTIAQPQLQSIAVDLSSGRRIDRVR